MRFLVEGSVRNFIVLSILCSCSAVAWAQSPAFDVTSVKPAATTTNGSVQTLLPGGGFRTRNNSVLQLIQFAFDVGDFQIAGLPDWARREGFDIEARSSGAPENEIRLMVRSLLAERFALKTHVEPRDMPIYSLRLVRRDGQLGPGLKRVEGLCPKPDPVANQQKLSNIPAGAIRSDGCGPIGVVARLATLQLDAKVIDDTGLTGLFERFLYFSPEGRSTAFVQSDRSAIDPNLPSLATALNEQAGLRLERTRGSVEVIVVDHLQRPSPN